MAAFNLTAELNLRGPSNINQVVGNIRRQLSTLTLDLNINPNTSRGVQAVTANIRTLSTALRDAQSNAAALSTTLSNLVTTINNAGNAAANAGNALNRLNTQTRAAQAAARDGATAMENFGAQSALAIRRFAAFSVATGAVYSFTRALSSAYSEFINFNKEFVRLQQVTNSSASGLAGLSQEITRLSTGLGVSSSELLTVSSTLAQAGLSANQTKTALEALAKSALAPSFDNLNETVEGSIALMRQFGLSAGDLESALGSINAVAAKFAVESSDIITAIQRTGGVFASASKGVSQGKDALNEFIAVFTSVRATTRESAETIATGLRTIFTRIQRGNTIQALKEYGITLTDLEGKFVGPYEAVRRLSEGLRGLDPRDLRFSEIVEELGGFRQIGKVIPLIQQFATAQQALSVAQRGAGSLAGDAAKAQESLAIRVNKVREEFIALIRDIGQTQSFQKFVDISLQLASALISVASAAKDVLPAITAIAAIRAVPAIAQFAGGFGRGITRRNEGGPIRKFATGGLVPGSGNRDTVPAMLTPGEFVIRKKAVETIGASNLARMNVGGKVQKFEDGGYVEGSALRALKQLTRDFLMPKSRKGGRRKISFVGQQAVSISKNISPELLKQIEEEGRLVYGTGLGALAKGDPGLIVDKIINVALAKTQKQKEGRLKKTQGALTFSAAGLQRGPRAPKGQMEKALVRYQQDPEYRKAMGLGASGDVLQALSAFRKSGGQTSLAGVFSEEAISKIESGIPRYIAALGNEPQKIAKAKTAQQYLRSFAGGATASKAGHATAFSETINQMLKSGIIQEFADGGFVQKFAQKQPKYNSGLVKSVQKAGSFENLINQNMVDSNGNYNFGLVSLRSGTKTGSRTETRPIEGTDKIARINVGVLSDVNNFNKQIEKDITSKLKESIFNTGKMLSGKLRGSSKISLSSTKQALGGATLSSATGSIFEAALQMVGAPYVDKIESIKSMDFPFGLGPAAPLFGAGFPQQVPTDATRTIGGSGKGISDFMEQVSRFVKATETGKFTKSLGSPIGTPSSLISSRLISQIKTPAQIEKVNEILRRFQIPNFRIGDLSDPKKLSKYESILNKSLQRNPNAIQALEVEQFATGGSVQDTVPALLTPGEFVINKTAAQRIGYSQLNRLNKADKVQGFNKGGAVGNIQNFANGGMVQSFFIGGAVQAGSQIIRQLPQLATAIAQAVRILPRNLPQGNGWLASNTGTRAMGLPQSRGGMLRNLLSDPMSLVFGSGLLGEGISGVIGGKRGEAAGSAFAGGAGVAGVVASIVGVTTPFGLLATATTGLIAGFNAYNKSIRDSNIAENNKKVEDSSERLSQTLDKLSQSGKITSTSLDSIRTEIGSIISAQQENIRSRTEEAQPGIMSNITEALYNIGTTFGLAPSSGAGRIDRGALSQNLFSESKTGAEQIAQTFSTLMQRGMTFNQISAKLDTGAKVEIPGLRDILGEERTPQISELSRSLAIAQRGTQITDLEAKLADLIESRNSLASFDPGREVFDIRIKETAQAYALAINASNAELQRQQQELNNVQKATAVVVSRLNLFAEAMKNVDAATIRASSEFEEAQRQIDVGVGSRLGGRATIAQPSRMNEAVLENLRAYSPEEISRTISQFGQNLNLNPEFTKRAQGAALSQRVLQTDLPKILNSIAAEERDANFGDTSRANTIRNQLKEALKAGGVTDTTEIDRVIEDVITNIEKLGKGEITFDTIAANSETFAKLFKTNSEALQAYSNVVKSANNIFANFVSKINEYSNAIEQSINTQLQANQIRAGGDIQLREALGQRVSLNERNQLFNNEILGMTATIGAGNRPIAGTGTTDPNEIARRLAAAEQRKRELEAQSTTGGPQKFASELSQVTIQINQYENALKKLANDTNRAANALNEISRLRQLRETRRESFLDFASNLNDPEYMTNFMQQAASLSAVMSGRGTMDDIRSAREGFQRRVSAGFVSQDQLQIESTQLTQQIVAILERAMGGPLPQGLREQIASDFGTLPEEQNAIKEYKDATEAQARATEIMGIRMQEGANYLFTKVREAGDLWVAAVRLSANQAAAQMAAPPGAPVQQAGAKAKGGLIYANEGQYIDFQPKGTDTVPAMLTPGEFVVNAKATKKNLGLLKQINSSGKASGFSKGGVVYLADGGQVEAIERDRRQYSLNIQSLKAQRDSLGYLGVDGQFVWNAQSGASKEFAEKRYNEIETEIQKAEQELANFNNKYPETPKPPAQQQAEQQRQQAQQQQQQQVPLSPKQKAQQEKERRKQAVLDEKERRKQAAMANNPGYAARVGREQAKQQKEQMEAVQRFPDLDPKDAIKEYRKEKRARVQEMNERYGRSVSIFTSSNNRQTDDVKIEESIGPILSQTEVEAIERKTYGGLTKAEYDNQRKQEEEARRARLDEIQASVASTETPEAKLEEQRRNKIIADYEAQQKIDKEKRNKSIAERQARDAEARNRGFRDAAQEAGVKAKEKAEAKIAEQRATDKEKRAADKASIEAGTNAGVSKTQRIQELLATDPAYENQRKDFALTEYIKTRIQEKYSDDLTDKKDPARDRANLERLISDATADYNAKRRQLQEQANVSKEKFANQNVQIGLQQFQEGVDKSPLVAAGTAIPKAGYGVIRAGVGYTVAGAMALKNLNPANRPEDIAFNNEIINSAMAQGEAGLQTILATGADLGYKLGLDNLDLITTPEAYGMGPAGAGLRPRMTMMEESDKQPSNIEASTEPSRGLFDKQGRGDAQARAAIANFIASGPRTSAYAGIVGDASTTPSAIIQPKRNKTPGAYQATAEMARARINQINEQEANKARGAYSTEAIKQNKTIRAFEESVIGQTLGLSPGSLGELVTAENVQRGATNIAQVAGEGAIDAFGGASSLVKSGEAAVAKGLTRAASATNRGIERVGGKLVDIAEAGIESARTNAPLLPQLPLPKIGSKITEALKARRVARETRRGQGALTREALETAEKNANLAEANRRISIIPMEDIQSDIAQRVTRGYESSQRLADMGLPPLDFSNKSLAQIARETSENITPENLPTTIRNFSKKTGTTKQAETASKAYEMSSREEFLRRQAEIQARKQAITQSDKSSGSLSTPLNQPESIIPNVISQPTPTAATLSTSESILMAKVARAKELSRAGLSGLSPSEQEIFQKLMRDPDVLQALNPRKVQNRSLGGLIYASKGTLVPYQPRGTDTVPAMLTPGEFVVNKAATQRNLPLLKAINNNSQYMSRGGKVSYFADGGQASGSMGAGGVSSFSLDSSAFSDAVGTFGTSVSELKTVLGNFGDGAGTLAKSATDLASAFGGISTSAGALSAAASILQGATQGLASPIAAFTSSIDRISSTLNNMKDINVNITGSIPPISIVVEVNGGDGLKDELKPFADEIYNKIGQRLAQATNGLFKIETTS
jgi:TP901 family phage tail tape measure protein